MDEILETFNVVKRAGLKQIQIGNIGIFTKNDEEMKRLINNVGIKAF